MSSNGPSRKNRRREHIQSWARHDCPPLPTIEYNIYSYSNDTGPRACWKKCGSTDHPESAISHAEELYKSGQYKKVEVKQRYFDSKTRRNIDHTCHVFENTAATKLPSRLTTLAVFSIMAIFVIGYALKV